MEDQFSRMRVSDVVCGPLLRYIGIEYGSRIYRGSCLVVSSASHAPVLEITLRGQRSGTRHQVHSKGERLDTFRHQYHFWRYELRLPLSDEPQTATYSVGSNKEEYTFHLPAFGEPMRFMFYSCNGFSDVTPETKAQFGGERYPPLWQDVLDRHEVMPFHVLLGGGDQLYQDRLIKEEFMNPWKNEKDPKVRLEMELTPTMREGFEHFFFWNYVKNFG